LRHDFRANGRPDEVDAVRTTDFFGVVEGGGGVAVADYEDVLGWEDFEGGDECGTDYSSGFVAGDEQSGIFCGGSAGFERDGFVGEGRVGFEEDEEGTECVTGWCAC